MKKRKKNISILFISDNRKEPISLKLKLGVFKFIIVGIGLIFLLIIVSGIYYYSVLGILADYDNMKEKSKQIEEYRKIVLRIVKKFESIENMDRQIRKLFGEEMDSENETRNDEKEGILKLLYNDVDFAFDEGNDIGLNFEKYSTSSRYIPYTIPVEGFMTKKFQKNDVLTGESHTGIDIVAKEGSVIKSVADGVVVFSNWTYEGGNVIIIDHLNGFISFYKHNKRLLVGEKSFVRRGQPIALMGNSGVSSGTHLHFEIWENGKPVDPRNYIINF